MGQGSLELMLQVLPASFHSERTTLDLQEWLMLMTTSVDVQKSLARESRTSRRLRGRVVLEDEDGSVTSASQEERDPFSFECCAPLASLRAKQAAEKELVNLA